MLQRLWAEYRRLRADNLPNTPARGSYYEGAMRLKHRLRRDLGGLLLLKHIVWLYRLSMLYGLALLVIGIVLAIVWGRITKVEEDYAGEIDKTPNGSVLAGGI